MASRCCEPKLVQEFFLFINFYMHNLPSDETFVAKTVDWLTCPYWESLETNLHQLVHELPSTGLLGHRSTLLTWIYQEAGFMTFATLVKRVHLDGSNNTHTRRGLRSTLKGMHRINLITVVTPKDTAQVGAEEDHDGEEAVSEPSATAATQTADSTPEFIINSKSRIYLTWAGMVWIRRSWTARMALMQRSSLLEVHSQICNEEDEGRSVDPYWIENLFSSLKEENMPFIALASDPTKRINFVFDLGAASKSDKHIL